MDTNNAFTDIVLKTNTNTEIRDCSHLSKLHDQSLSASDSDPSLPDFGVSEDDDILSVFLYFNEGAKGPSEFSQLQENKDRRVVDIGCEGRSTMMGKASIAANEKFVANKTEFKPGPSSDLCSRERAEKRDQFSLSEQHSNVNRRRVYSGYQRGWGGRSAMTGMRTIAANRKFEAYDGVPRTKSCCNVKKKSDIRKVESCSNLNKCRRRETRPQRSFTDLRQNRGQSGCQHRCQDDGRSPGAGKWPTMSYKALSHTYWYVINNKQLERNMFQRCQMRDSELLQHKVLMYEHIIHYMEILACTSRGDSGWYIADTESRHAENVRRLKRYYMSYREVCSLLDSGSTNKQDRQACYGGGKSSFPRRMRREGSPRSDHERNDKIVTMETNYPLSTVDRLTSDQYVSSSKVKPGARSIDTKSRRHQHDEHSLPVGADARINQPDAWMLVKGADSKRHNPDARELVKGADSSRSSVKQRDLKPHSNVNEHKTEDRRRRLPSNTTRESVSKHSLINQEAKGQRDSNLKGDPSSSIHQDQSSSGQKAHLVEKDSGKRHHEPPTESHQKFRSRTNVYTQDSKSHKISRTCYHEQAVESQGEQLQDRDYHREKEPLFGDRRRRSKSRSRWMDDRDTERHCTQREVREDNKERRPSSQESRQKSQDHEDGRFTSKTPHSESKRRRENSRELDRKRAPKGRLETPSGLQVGMASEESKASLDNRKQVQSTVEVREGEDPCTKSSTELHQTGSEAESFSSSDHSRNSLQQASASRPSAKASGKKKKCTSILRQSVASTLALLKQAEVFFDEKLDQLSFPGAAGEEPGEHKPHAPNVGRSNPQHGEHILQPFNLCVRDSDGPNQRPSSSDKAVGDFDALKQNTSSTDNDRIGCDRERHNLSPPNQTGQFFDTQNQQCHSELHGTADKSQMRWEGMHVCNSSDSLRNPNKGLEMDVKQDCVDSLEFSGCSTSSQGRDSVSNRKHYLSHDISPIELAIKRQKTLSTDEFNLTRLQWPANSGITAAKEPVQPIFHSVELRPIDGEPLFMSSGSLAHSISEERTVNNNNSGEVRAADKTHKYRFLLPGKITDETSTCSGDKTLEMTHSSPRYSEFSDKQDNFTTDSDLDSIEMSDFDEESNCMSHRSRIQFSRDLSSSQDEEDVLRRQAVSCAMNAGNTTERGKTGKAAYKRRLSKTRRSILGDCGGVQTCTSSRTSSLCVLESHSRSPTFPVLHVNEFDGVHGQTTPRVHSRALSDSSRNLTSAFPHPHSSRHRAGKPLYALCAATTSISSLSLGHAENRTACGECSNTSKRSSIFSGITPDKEHVSSQRNNSDIACTNCIKINQQQCVAINGRSKVFISSTDSTISGKKICEKCAEDIAGVVTRFCNDTFPDNANLTSDASDKINQDLGIILNIQIPVRIHCRCKCVDTKDSGQANYKCGEYRRPAVIELEMSDSLVTSTQNGRSVYMNVSRDVIKRCSLADPRVRVMLSLVPDGINNDSTITMSPGTQQKHCLSRNIVHETDVRQHIASKIAQQSCHRKQEEICLPSPKIQMLESRNSINKTQLLSLVEEFCEPCDLISPLSSDDEDYSALPTISMFEYPIKIELTNKTTNIPSGDPSSREIPRSIFQKCFNNNNKKRGNNKDIINHGSMYTQRTEHTQKRTSTEMVGAQFSHKRTPSYHVVCDNLLTPQVLTPYRRMFLVHDTSPRGRQKIDTRISCDYRFACQPTGCNCFLESFCRRALTSVAYDPERYISETKLISRVTKGVIDSRLFMLSNVMLAGNDTFVNSDDSTIPTTSSSFELNPEAVSERRPEYNYCRDLTIKVISVSRKTKLSHFRELKLDIFKGISGNTGWKSDETNRRFVYFGSLYASPALYWATLAGVGEYHLSVVTFGKPLTTHIGPDSFGGLNSIMLLDKQMNAHSLDIQRDRWHSIPQQSRMVLFSKLYKNKRILYLLSVNRSLAFGDVPIRRDETLRLTRSSTHLCSEQNETLQLKKCCDDLSSKQNETLQLTKTCDHLTSEQNEALQLTKSCDQLSSEQNEALQMTKSCDDLCSETSNCKSRIVLTDCAAQGSGVLGVLCTSGNVRLRERHVGRNISSQRKEMKKYKFDFTVAQIQTKTIPPEVTIPKLHYEANVDYANDLPTWRSLSKMKNGGRKKDFINKLTMCLLKKGKHLERQTSQDSDNNRKRCKNTRDDIRFLDSNNNADNEGSRSTSRRKNTTRSGQAMSKLPQKLHKKPESEEKQRQQKGKSQQQQQTQQQDQKEQERDEETHLPELAESGERYGDVQSRLREVRINLLKTYRAQQVSSHKSSFVSVFDQLPEDDDNTNADQQENTDFPSADEPSGTLPQIPMANSRFLGRSSSFASASELEKNKVLKFVQRMNTSYGDRLVKGNAANKERLTKVCNHYLNMNWAKKQVEEQPKRTPGIFSSPPPLASLSNLKTKPGDLQCSSVNASDTCQRAADALQNGKPGVRSELEAGSTDKAKTKSADKASDSVRKNTVKMSETKTVNNKTESKTTSTEVIPKSEKRNKTSTQCVNLKTPVNKRLNPHIAVSANRLSSRPPGQAVKLLHGIHNWEEEFGRPLSLRPGLDCLSLVKDGLEHAQTAQASRASQPAHISKKARETKTEHLGKQKGACANTSRVAKKSGQLNTCDKKLAALETDHHETIDEDDEEDDDLSCGSDSNPGSLSVNAHLAKLSMHALARSKSAEKIDMPDLQEESQSECLDSMEKIYNEMQAQSIERCNALQGLQQVRNKHALVEDVAAPETTYEAFGLGTLSPLNPVISEESPFGFLNLVDHPPVSLLSENSSNIYRRLEENQYLGAGGYKDDKQAPAQRSSPKTKLSIREGQQNNSGREPSKLGRCSEDEENKDDCDPLRFVNEVNEIKYIANIAESQFTGEEGVFHAAALPSGMGGAFLRDLLKLNRNSVIDASFDGSERRSLNLLGDSDSEAELVAQTALEDEAGDLHTGDDSDEDNEEDNTEGVAEQKEGICSRDINVRGDKRKGNGEENRDENKETCEQTESSRAKIDNINAKNKGHYDKLDVCDSRDDETASQTKTSNNEESAEENYFREVGMFNAGLRSLADVSDRFIPLESEGFESLESLKRAADMSFRGEFRFVPQLGMQFLDVKDGLRPSCSSSSVKPDRLSETRGLADVRFQTVAALSPIAELREEDVMSPPREAQGRYET